MLRTYQKITFTSKTDGSVLVFNFVNSVEVSTSYETLTDTAVIKMPKRVNVDGKPITGDDVNSIFKRGDKVKIELGYFPNLKTVFEGYITTVNVKSPIIIECDDEMYVLKNTPIAKYSKVAPSLTEFLDAIVPDTITRNETLEIAKMGTLTFSNMSVCEIFDVIKKEYGIYFYFVDSVLNVGNPSNASDTETVRFIFENNIIDDTSLKFQREQDVRLKIKAISMNYDNEKLEKIVGDNDGALRTYHYYNTSLADMEKFANLLLTKNKFTGYRGDMLTFGEPLIRHGDHAELKSYKYPAKDGTYQVKSVTRTLNVTDGYKQSVELDIKVA